ncbi:type I polyketide synthase [Paraflavitalea speifideaquila]|uniref:type I polyketide synthase n=1 Tax=Paraflavitalea speifideaquila TaxID=3076558 RepID=UPI0028EAC9CB|nr:type I polyketide synthase [Paraflavitalea speifideiaquila]
MNNTAVTETANSAPSESSIVPAPAVKVAPPEGPVSNLLLEKTVYQLKVLFAGIVKYPVHQIDEQEALENYGIDSIMIVELNKQLAVIFGDLPATLFYQYQSLGALAGWLVQDHHEPCIAWTGVRSQPATQPPVKTNKPITKSAVLSSSDSIAIIGISGRYPQASNLDEYWDNLRAGKDCITEIPADRWAVDGFFHADSEQAASLGKSYGKWGGFINDFAGFDARFFNISPKEARGTDPQARLFLETCWQVLEDAGYTRATLKKLYQGNVGVYAGVTRTGFSCYGDELMKHGQYVINATSAIANRVSYFFNLKGPSVPVDTMCSSSLTSIHYAVESLLKGECAMALAGGVNLLLHPSDYVLLSANNFLSADGRCRSFGVGGTGYVPGEGVGAVLLKPLSRAISDKDHIYAVIKGSSINHGGKTNGYTVPNPVAQGDLIRQALDKAQVNARMISYVEAHGTGTMLGDPIEIAGLTQAFSTDTSDTQYCAIGSAKSNIGHLEAAAGIAGITKIILQMKHGQLAPSLHAASLNPNIQFDRSPFVVQQSLSAWQRPVTTINGTRKEWPRMAGISSFGAGGSNAHMILEEFMPAAY